MLSAEDSVCAGLKLKAARRTCANVEYLYLYLSIYLYRVNPNVKK